MGSRRSAADARVRGLVRVIPLPSGGAVWGGGYAPSPGQFLRVLPENGAFWLHFFLQRGAWPK